MKEIDNIISSYNDKKTELKQIIENSTLQLKELDTTFGSVILTKREENRKQNKIWFIKHFDWIYKNNDLLGLGTSYGNIIIDFLDIYSLFWRPYNYQCLTKITLGRLFYLWKLGYKYQGFPILSFYNGWRDSGATIMYIEEKEIKEVYIPKKDGFFPELCMKELKNLTNYQPSDYEIYRTIDELKPFIK